LKYLIATEKTALVHNGGCLSFRDLLVRVDAFAAPLQDLPCERVAVFSENRWEWVVAFYAVWYARKTAVPIDYLSTPEEVAYILEDCKPGVIFCSAERYQRIEAVLQSLSYPIRVQVFEEMTLPVVENLQAVFPDLGEELTAMLIYTSGTTGSPKGVMLSFKNVNINIRGVNVARVFTEESVMLGLLPLHHTFPLMGTMMGPLALQGKLVLCPSMASEDIMRTLQEHRITTIVSVPRFYNLIRKGIRDKNRAACGGPEVVRIGGEAAASRIFQAGLQAGASTPGWPHPLPCVWRGGA
jgi:long-chain acyl-CoA synthetase